jgi:hypothetical protein
MVIDVLPKLRDVSLALLMRQTIFNKLIKLLR